MHFSKQINKPPIKLQNTVCGIFKKKTGRRTLPEAIWFLTNYLAYMNTLKKMSIHVTPNRFQHLYIILKQINLLFGASAKFLRITLTLDSRLTLIPHLKGLWSKCIKHEVFSWSHYLRSSRGIWPHELLL